MTDDSLRKMAHHELVDYVQTRITGHGPVSTYVQNDDASAVRNLPHPSTFHTPASGGAPQPGSGTELHRLFRT
jgi:hypothetical protein